MSAVARCAQCGTPLRARASSGPGPLFCCYGCVLVNQIAGTRSERGEPAWILGRLGIAGFLAMNVMSLSLVLYAGDPIASGRGADPFSSGFASILRYVMLLFSAPVMALLGWPILGSALRGRGRRGSAVDALIVVGSAAAFGLSAWATIAGRGAVYYETACMVLVLVTLGRYLEARARAQAASDLRATEASIPSVATVLGEAGPRSVPAAEVRPGDLVRVAPGERIPVDGDVVEGEGAVDESTLTGEPLPVRKNRGAAVFAGTASLDAALHVRAARTGPDATAARIARLVDAARLRRAPIERLAERVAAAFVPLAAFLALGSGLYWGAARDPASGLMHALAVLLVACPCALGLATPLAVWRAIGRAAQRGVVIRSGEALERLACLRAVLFDKTGTLTDPLPLLREVRPAHGWEPEALLGLAAAVESVSGHPLARSVVAAARERGLAAAAPRRFRVLPGVGVEGEVARPDGVARAVAVGGGDLLARLGLEAPEGAGPPYGCSRAFVVVDGRIAGILMFEERLREGAAAAIAGLRREGLRVEVLTGDGGPGAWTLERRFGIPVRAGLTAAAKAEAVADVEREAGPAAMVGEGVNDAPALARASLSVVLGCGADLARDAADVALARDDLREIPWLVDLGKGTLRVIRANLFWAFAYNVVLLPVASAGGLQPILAALAMVASGLFVTLNSLATGRPRRVIRTASGTRASGRSRWAGAEAR